MSDEPEAPAQQSPFPPGTISAPMNPAPGVASTVVWEKGTRQDGTVVVVMWWMLGAASFRVEVEEAMAEKLIEGFRDIFHKPTLTIARNLPESNGGGKPGPLGPYQP